MPVRDIPIRALLSTGEHLTADQIGEFATPLFALFGGPTVPRPEGVPGLPFLRYHDEISNDSDGLVEFCCPVKRWLVDHNELSDWKPRQIFLLDPAAANATDPVYELAVRLR